MSPLTIILIPICIVLLALLTYFYKEHWKVRRKYRTLQRRFRVVIDAEEERSRVLQTLNQERESLEKEIEQLKVERDAMRQEDG
jgi:cell division protein FtsB